MLGHVRVFLLNVTQSVVRVGVWCGFMYCCRPP